MSDEKVTEDKITLPTILAAQSVDHDAVDRLGQAAYEAFRRELFGGEKVVPWEKVDGYAKRAWQAAAIAVLAEQVR